MELWQALLLGLVEGLTEYLPVSSTGHLLVTQRLMGIPASEEANAFAIAVQAGAIVAVLGLYRKRCAQIALGALGKDPAGLRLGIRIAIAFLPAAVLGVLFDDAIERFLFGFWPIVGAWAAGGVLILVIANRLPKTGFDLDTLAIKGAVIIGFAQCVALWPGTSRSLATILGGLAAGLSLGAAVEFSFLLGLVTLGAATAYKALGHGEAMIEAYGVLPVAAGFAAAWVSAVISVKWMVAWLQNRGLSLFGWWRLAAAAGVTALLLTGAA
jgi:undecaprenyl-diphosphatase